MHPSLYETYATPTVLTSVGGPGTVETKAIETVDNDVAVVMGQDLGAVGARPYSSRLTAAVETTDEESTTLLYPLGSRAFGPRPGSALTASVETSDEDAATALHSLP